MAHLLYHLLILGLIICSNACSPPVQEDIKHEAQHDILVGRIAAIYPDAGYMLIQSYKTIRADENSIFYSRAQSGQIHALSLSEQKLGQFYVADIKENAQFSNNDPIFQRSIEAPSQGDLDQGDRANIKTPL